MKALGRVLAGFWVAPVVAATLLWAAFPPLDLGFLAPAGFAVLLASMRVRGGEKAGRQALVFGMLWFLAGIRWIAPLVSAGWVFVSFWCAMFEVLWAWSLRRSFRAARDGRDARWVLAAPLLHLGFDMVRTVLFTGFPWLIPGYTGWRNPVLLGSADLVGVHGATLAIVALGAGIAEVVARRVEGRAAPWRPLAPAVGLWAALAAWAFAKPGVAESPGPTVLVLQASIPQALKEDREASGAPLPSLEDWWGYHERLAAEGIADAARSGGRVDVVVWPETMVPLRAVAPIVPGRPFRAVEPDPGSPDGKGWRIGGATCARVVRASGGARTLAGVLSEDVEHHERNSAVLLDAQGRVVGTQDKQHLTPGGETLLFLDWLPDGLRKDVEKELDAKAGFVPNLVAGQGHTLLPLGAGGTGSRAGILICYESIFPSMSRSMVRGGADVLVNLSNYGWFTGTAEMEQALAMAAFRSAELRRPMVLASNNGISAVVGPDGRVRARTPSDVRTYLLAPVPLASGTTPFAVVGEWAAWGLGSLGLLLALRRRRAEDGAEAPKTS